MIINKKLNPSVINIVYSQSLYFESIDPGLFGEAPAALNHSHLGIDRSLVVDLMFTAVLFYEVDLVIVQLSFEIKFTNLVDA